MAVERCVEYYYKIIISTYNSACQYLVTAVAIN